MIQIQSKKKILYILFLISISFIAYWSSLEGGFLSDDYVHIYYMQKMDNDISILLKNFYSNWLDVPTTAFYRPLISVTLYLDHLLWGWNPFGYHLTNLIFHTFNGALIFLIISNYSKKNNQSLIFLIAILFVIHPIHPESVYWIIGRVDSQSTFFYLLSLYSFLLFNKTNFYRYSILSMLSFVLALASKEPAITLPAILLICVFYKIFLFEKESFFKSVLKSFIKTKIYWFIIILYLILRYYALGTIGGGYNGASTNFFTLEYIVRWLDLLYLFIPINMSIYNTFHFTKELFIIGWLGILILIIFRKYEKQYLFLIFFLCISFIITLIPISTVFKIFNDLEASRFLYLPSAIFFIFLGILLQDNYFHTKRFYFYFLNFFLLFLVFLSFFQLKQNLFPWENSTSEMKFFVKELDKIVNEREKKSQEEKSIVLTGIPDSINGAQFLRNGYAGLFSNAFRNKQLNNVLPILDNDFYKVKSVEIKNNLRNDSSNLYGVYRYEIGIGFRKVKQENLDKKELNNGEVSLFQNDLHHLEIKNGTYFPIGAQPWIKFKLSTEKSDVSNILLIKLVLEYNSINEISKTLQLYWTNNDIFIESKSIKNQFLNCKNTKCEYIFPVLSSENWNISENYKNFMISMPSNSTSGFNMKHIDVINNQDVKIMDIKSLDFSLFNKVEYNEEANSISFLSNNNEYLKLPRFNINPIFTDYISFDMKISDFDPEIKGNTKLYWTTNLQNQMSESKSININLINNDKFNTYIFPLKHLPLWWTIGDINQLSIVPFYGKSKLEIKNISIGGNLIIPNIKFKSNEIDKNKLSLISGTSSVFKRIKSSEDVILEYILNDYSTDYSLILGNMPPYTSNLLTDNDKYLKKYFIDKAHNQFVLKTSDLKTGMYFLRIIRNDESINSLTSDTIAILIE